MTEAFAEPRENEMRIPRVADFSDGNEHPVIRLPFHMLINGRSYAGTGLSLVGAEAIGLVEPSLSGKVQLTTLVFDFPGYALTLPVQAAIAAGPPEDGTLSLRFVEPTGPHYPHLRYLLNAFVAGDTTNISGLLRVTAPKSTTGRSPDRKASISFFGILGTGMRWAMLSAVTLGLLSFVGIKLYERIFVVTLPGLSSIALQGMSLRAISSGQLDFVNPDAKLGEIAFVLRISSGETLAVSMPCDCVVAPGHEVTGATVLAGDEIMSVAPLGAPTVIDTQVDTKALRMLANGASAEVQLPDGTFVEAVLDRVQLPAALRAAADGTVPLTLTPKTPLPADLVGSPVDVRIKTAPLAIWNRILAEVTGLLSKANGAS